MKFKGTIIITDPCYIIKEHQIPNNLVYPDIYDYVSHDRDDEYPDYKNGCSEICKQEIDKYLEAVHNYQVEFDKYDDWRKCDYGDDMDALGITNCICEDTIYGDWSCTTLEVDNPREVVDELAELVKVENYNTASKKLHQFNYLGQFCADAGEVAVFLLDEVLKYNPDFANWSKEHDWCVTTIKDFDGDIEYYVDDNTEAHIIGTGNINFATFQTGL